ncbi:hypothetical protein [Bordetella phage vB_BbrM_PHB04]|uniref:YspA cpYpsA-related SLOG domain-containing protein n=1 Tax=Bordetella phage vB_BbrM_PHB04 TaxID=2029657 RepID=A0A291L9X7_9CAUD|nr:GTP-binding domain [Bordetella phage vB_BbrM_PHB04]ATI15672.1 hypothetical protein [Bordetella phage vB_BbrM_PHB04]
MKLLVCGGRDYADREAVFAALDRVHAKRPVTLLIHGAARGADSLADDWARARGVPRDPHPADWATHGRRAGPLRNRKMLELKPDGVVAFPGGRGTADMADAARAAGVPVWEPVR